MTTGKRKGGALLTVLWLSAALAAIAFSVATNVRTEIGRVSTSADGLRAYYLASGSVERAIQWMLWGNDFGNYWQYNKPRLNFSYPSGDVAVEMIPEATKLNINTAGLDDLTRVVAAVTGNPMQAQEIAMGILAWRSGQGGPTMGFPTFPGSPASFQEIEELLMVRGMTPELFYGNYVSDNQGRLYASGGLRDCLSIWGSQGPFDVNTMSPALMQAMGVPPDGAAAIAARRQVAPFSNMGEVGQMGIATQRMIVGPAGSRVIWTIRATARLRRPDGSPSDVVRSASATVKLLDPKIYFNMPVWTLRWYDDGWSEHAVAPPGTPLPGAPLQ